MTRFAFVRIAGRDTSSPSAPSVPHCFTDVLILGGGLAGLRALRWRSIRG